ncbi:hypothetical protein DFA_03135 [Cavenderia fasciculata]|uniref:Uncharacterized protein n=1 Tax=Cavenderia fasciculata TaxID=261658 RepID=F4PGQ6_CACFS|nr:uncharacterized protein DFA_03135 [Cavenderia fasciculata]EGG24890.1 hypothetical protein DFA_03135 [Cavenderia fasciculata]|eukprot:XP_004362741.1 hypothetical protein DFA_03135 [Cavenderia fasciculata]
MSSSFDSERSFEGIQRSLFDLIDYIQKHTNTTKQTTSHELLPTSTSPHWPIYKFLMFAFSVKITRYLEKRGFLEVSSSGVSSELERINLLAYRVGTRFLRIPPPGDEDDFVANFLEPQQMLDFTTAFIDNMLDVHNRIVIHTQQNDGTGSLSDVFAMDNTISTTVIYSSSNETIDDGEQLPLSSSSDEYD